MCIQYRHIITQNNSKNQTFTQRK